MSMNITRFSDFNTGADVAARTPKKIDILGIGKQSPLTVGRGSTTAKKRANHQARLDEEYANGYKTALLDVLYLDGSQNDPNAMVDPSMMDPATMGMDPSMMGQGPVPPAPPFDPQVAAMMGIPGIPQGG